MSRETKFRGKTKEGEWLIGDLVHGALNAYSYTVDFAIQKSGFYPIEVNPETVGQFTGLKDATGKDIFERDIVSYLIHTYKVGFHNGSFGLFSLKHTGFTPFFESVNLSCEIIGNIPENPELLK